MIKNIPCKFFVVFLLAIYSFAYSQQYPIQLTTQLVPPFSGYLDDYSDDVLQKMRLLVVQTDLSEPSYDIKLKIKIEGQGIKIQSKSYYYAGPFNLQPGVPVMLSGADLAGLLSVSNLDFSGIKLSDYEKKKVLPEGNYEICITAYDYNNPVQIQVSKMACAQAWMIHSDPPYLNLPLCNSKLKTQEPQTVLFQWTAMNLGSPNSASVTEYEFSLYEIRPAGQNPNNIVQTIPPVYQTTVTVPIINYGITEPPLIKGMQYAWRVRAVDQSGRDYFKNNGYSQVCTFTYGSIYDGLAPLLLKVQALTIRSAKFSWDKLSVYTQYEVEYRKTGNEEYHWFSLSAAGNNTTTYDLEENTEYMARLRGITGEGNESEWTDIIKFGTPVKNEIACGDMPTGAPIPGAPLQAAAENMIWQVGQFEMTVTKLFNNTSFAGRYSGEGKIKIPFMGFTLAVEYDNILVDEARVVVAGEVRAKTKGIDQWEEDIEIKEAEENATYVEGTIDSVYYSNGQICVITKENPNPVCNPADTTGITVVRDGEGNEVIVYADGTTKTKNFLHYSNDSLSATRYNLISFSPSPSRQWGFDEKTYAAFADQYEVIKLSDTSNYFVPYIGVAEGREDRVKAKFVTLATQYDNSLINFITQNKTKLNHTSTSNNEFEITIPHNAEAVYAFYNGEPLGKLNVTSLKALTRKLVIVPVGSISLSFGEGSGVGPVGSGLNSIYQQANVSWEVSIAPVFNNTTWDINHDNKLGSADAKLFDKYSEEMRLLKSAYQKFDSTYDRKAYYVFVVNQFSDPGQQGYMVRNKAVGFATPLSFGEGQGVRLLAHELAHGAFGLEHTFPKAAQGTTNNLLDYISSSSVRPGGASHLTNKQWQQIHSFIPVFSWLDEEEDGSAKAALCDNLNFDGQYFIAPNGFVFKMPAGGKPKKSLQQANGSVSSISINGKEFSATGFTYGTSAYNGFKSVAAEELKLSYLNEASNVNFVIEENNWIKIYKLNNYEADKEASNTKFADGNYLYIYKTTCDASNIVCSAPVNKAGSTITDALSSLKNKLQNTPVDGTTYVYERGRIWMKDKDGKSEIKPFSPQQADSLKKKIREGNFDNDYELFFEKTPKGYTVAIGYNKDLIPKYGDKEDLKKCADLLEQRTNKYLEGKNDLAKQEAAVNTPSIADQGEIGIMPSSLFKKIGQVVKAGKDIIVEAQLPESTWDKENAEYNNSVIHIPSFAAGIGDGAIEEAKETIVLVAYGADLVFNADSRQKLVDGFKNLSWEKIKNGVKDHAKDWANIYAQQNSKSYHQGGKDAVMVFTLISGVGAIKELAGEAKDGLESKADDIAVEVEKRGDEIEHILDYIADDEIFETLSKEVKYLPGPLLPDKIAATFEKSVYLNRKLISNERYFKYHGVNNRTGKKYTWVTNQKYLSEDDLRKGLAIRADWGVTINQVSEFDVPSGTWISEGKAAAQGIAYPGGDYQGVIMNIPKSWIIKTTQAF